MEYAAAITRGDFALHYCRLELTYLAEGNANVIFSIRCMTPEPGLCVDGCVLRLRKDLPFTEPSTHALTAYKRRIQPLFIPGYAHLLLEQSLFKLDETILHDAQSILRALERDTRPNRPYSRRNVYLPGLDEESYGILMPNLTRRGMKLLEFKPKWLLQSPSAPHNADKGRGDSGFCPFQLLADNPTTILKAIGDLDPVAMKPSFISSFILKVQPALRHLQSLQLNYNQVGLSDFEGIAGDDLAVAMALRDCSAFLIVDPHPEHPEIVEVKFADLELKSPGAGKQEHWASIERSLLDSGAYLFPDNICALGPGDEQI
ncbi:hypothetical protein DV738_g1171, partial [Chaetothyriales sp. CBS 135597]